jgi:hypothetical protein
VPPIKGEGTMNTPNMLVDSNGNVVTKTMIEVEIDNHRQFVYLDAEQAAIILMVMRIMPYGEF